MIYLDHNASTPAAEEVIEAMLPYFNDRYANAASRIHAPGARAFHAVNQSRATIASMLHVDEQEIVFTSGATEALNLAIKGVALKYKTKGKHILVSSTEHKAVIDCVKYLEKQGFEKEWIPNNIDGIIDINYLNQAIRKDTILVCCMHSNNETGTIQPIEAVAQLCAERGVIYLCDATQTIGKLRILPKKTGIPVLAASAHKFYGPKGIGFLYISRKAPRIMLEEQMHGGGHERGFRSGTLNVPAIVGMAKALEICTLKSDETNIRMLELRNLFESQLFQQFDFIKNTVPNKAQMNHVSHLIFEGYRASELMSLWYNELAAATGSACSSDSPEPSHVLKAMGLSNELAQSAIRFSFGTGNQLNDALQAAQVVSKAIRALQE